MPVRRSDGEDASYEDVLEAGDEEETRVLIVESFEFVVVDLRLGVPWLLADPDEDECLDAGVDQCLANDGCQNLLRDKRCGRPLGVDLGVWESASHGHCDRNDDEQVNVQELEVAQRRGERVEQCHSRELDEGIQRHVLETAEGGH